MNHENIMTAILEARTLYNKTHSEPCNHLVPPGTWSEIQMGGFLLRQVTTIHGCTVSFQMNLTEPKGALV